MKKTNVGTAFSRFLSLALLVGVFSFAFTSLSAQTISPLEALELIESEKADIQQYFQDKFPTYPDVKPVDLTSVDWDQVNRIYALNSLTGQLQDSNVLSMEEEVRAAAQIDYPDSGGPGGLFYQKEKHPKSADNPVVLELYLRNLLDL